MQSGNIFALGIKASLIGLLTKFSAAGAPTRLPKAILACGLLFAGLAWASQQSAQAPGFSLPELQSGQPIRLEDYRGKVVYLDFWASWCESCRKSLPLLNNLREELQPSDRFEIVAINVDANPAEGVRVLEEYPVSFPVVSDPAGRLTAQYDLNGMPSAFIIDAKGRIYEVHQDFQPSDLETIRDTLIRLLEAGGV